MHLGGAALSAAEPGSLDAAERSFDEAGRTFPVVFEDRHDRGYGYYRSLMAAMGGQNEVIAGMHSGLQELLPARDLHRVEERPWHAHLRERLGALGRPNFLRVYVFECPNRKCRAWQLSNIVDPTGQQCLQCKTMLLDAGNPPHQRPPAGPASAAV